MHNPSKASVTREIVREDAENQRLDNFLLTRLKGVPKSHVYRIVRNGEVRVNSRRADPAYRLQLGDELRIPPIRTALAGPIPDSSTRGHAHARETRSRAGIAGVSGPLRSPTKLVPRFAVLLEDEDLLAIDKPAGVAAHGGSGISFGVIEQLRRERPEAKFMELVHRLDKETSGVLLLAKKRAALVALHAALREGQIKKRYLALVKGSWGNKEQSVSFPLRKYLSNSGERRVSVDRTGRPAHSVFRLLRSWEGYSLLEAELLTGRMHQIRVHLAHLGFPIAGDDKYGDFGWNKELRRAGLRRMFLHAASLSFVHPRSGGDVIITAPLPSELERFIDQLGSGA
jgi:23S rRNA pseudouridine955/2504/2580 synthase